MKTARNDYFILLFSCIHAETFPFSHSLADLLGCESDKPNLYLLYNSNYNLKVIIKKT